MAATNQTQSFRDAIYSSTISVVASNAGNQVTYACEPFPVYDRSWD